MRNGGNQIHLNSKKYDHILNDKAVMVFSEMLAPLIIQPIVGSQNFLSSCKEWKSITKLEDINHLASLDTSDACRNW
jgi:hypothetical protein